MVVVARIRRSFATERLSGFGDATVRGVLQAAGLLFFAFAGYARIATLGEEVRDPARTIPLAIPIALGITLVVYAIVAIAVLAQLGGDGIGGVERSTRRRRPRRRTSRPRTRDPCRRGRRSARVVVVADPRGLEDDAGDGPRSSPAARSGRASIRGSAARTAPRWRSAPSSRLSRPSSTCARAIGFSAFAVLMYYAIANASA